MEWAEAAVTERGVSERGFRVRCEGRSVPGVLWRPAEASGLRPLVLLGHGGTTDKRAAYLVAIARRLARHHEIASFAIDGPGHGERRSDPSASMTEKDFDAAWASPDTTDHITADWRASLDAVAGELAPSRIGYFGLSMGTMMGVPLIAAERRIEAAVIGLMGDWGPNAERLRKDAVAVRIPLRFLVQWDDEIVPRERCLSLFDTLGAKRKQLRAHPGKHAAVPVEEMRTIGDFLASELGEGSG